jgi:mannose-6-phosphate isomerase-like protein (cupin superfamily)
MSYTIKNLREVEDAAEKGGFSDTQEARFAHGELDAESTGLGLIAVKPGQRQPFAHRHNEAEEIYVVLSGSGRLKLDDELIEIRPMDAIRMGPSHTRAIEAGPDGIEVLAFGRRHAGDAQIVEGDFWED